MPDRWIDDHIGDEVTARPGFEEELEASLRTAWAAEAGTEPVRRVPLGAGRFGRPRRLVIAGLGAAAALAAIVAAVVVAGDDDHSSLPADPTSITGPSVTTVPSPTTQPPATTTGAPSTTSPVSAAPTTSAVAPATTPVPPTVATTPPAQFIPTEDVPTDAPEGFFPECDERAGQPGADARMPSTSFGPLDHDPALTIQLPAAVDPVDYPANQRITSPKTQAVMIPGGVLLMLNQSNGSAGSLLAAVNLDGTTRWVRCTSSEDLVGGLLPPVSPDTPAFVRLRSAADVGDVAPRWVELDLSSGTFGGSLTQRLTERDPSLGELPPLTLVGQSPTRLLLASYSPLSGQDDLLLLVDRSSLAAEVLPDAGATASDLLVPSLDALGRPVLSSTTGRQDVDAVFVDGAWTSDDDALHGIVNYTFDVDDAGSTGPMRAVDATGATLWQLDGVRGLNAEGFHAGSTGDVTIVRGCLDPQPQPGRCDEPGLVGVSSTDGTELWRKSGWWDVGPLGDGVALLAAPPAGTAEDGTSDGAWMMIHASDGQPIDGQHWASPDAFATQCCGGYDYVHTARSGGTVIAVNERTVTVWFPAGTGLAPATATLP